MDRRHDIFALHLTIECHDTTLAEEIEFTIADCSLDKIFFLKTVST